MAYQSKYTGLQIDDILDSVEWKQGKIEDLASIRAGAAKGATALQSYTEKYTGTVTGIKINGVVKSGSGVIDLGTITTDISGKVDKVAGKQLSTEDFTTALKTKLEGLSNYDDTELSNAVETLRGDFDKIVSGDTTTAIKTFNEVIAFLDGLTDTQDLESIIASIEQQIAGKQDELISGTNIKTINGESILGTGDITIKERELEKYATDKSWSIVASSIQELDEEHGNAPDGTKAIVVTEANSLYGVNLFDSLTGNVDGMVDVISNLFAYTLEISAIDTNVELPVSITNDVRVTLPFYDKIYIDMGADMASIYQISVQAGFTESVWYEGHWLYTSYMIGNKIPLSSLLSLDDNTFAGLMAIAPALIVNFVGTKTITEYIKNGDNWEIWSEGESVLDTKLNMVLEQIAQSLPTKTSQLENDSNFITSDGLKTINGESIVGSGDITISGGSSSGSGVYPEVDGSIYGSEWSLGYYEINDMQPNTFYVFPECTGLGINTFGSETSGVANEFLFQFTSGATATTLMLPDDIKWAEELVIEPNRIYQVSILKGLASVLSWENINVITFTCNGVTYEAESNMTWQQFTVSDYNVLSWNVSASEIFTGGGYLCYNGSRVKYDDIIIENGSYYIEQGGGGGGA